jgi:crotonobetaine/carnitine-CoA ligase
MATVYSVDDDLAEGERTLPAIWQRRAAIRRGEPFLWFGGQVARTAAQLDAEIRAAAQTFRRRGIKKGDRVCVLMKNSPEMLAVMLGLWQAGAVVVPLSAQMVGPLLLDQVSRARVALAVADDDLAPQLAPLAVPVVEKGRFVGEAASADSAGALETAVSFQDPALILYTSGSTGPSKGCMLSQHFCVYYGWIFWRYMGYRRDDVIHSCLPLNHVHALFASFLPAVLAGAQYSFSERFSASRYWQEIVDSGATTCSAIGPMASILLKQPPCKAEARLRVRLAHIAPAPPGVEEFQERFRLRVASTLFGMTEAMLFPPDPQRDPVPGVIGVAPADWDVALLDDFGREVAAGEPGELVARPQRPYILFDGYFDMPQETVKAWQGLWYHTGDVCRRDADGLYWFMGRKRDQIRRRGESISAWELESLLGAHPAVSEIAALGVPSPLGEEEIVVFVRHAEGAPVSAAALEAFSEKVVPRFMRPDRIVIGKEELPKTPSGKIDKRRLQAILSEQRSQAGE